MHLNHVERQHLEELRAYVEMYLGPGPTETVGSVLTILLIIRRNNGVGKNVETSIHPYRLGQIGRDECLCQCLYVYRIG